MTLKIISILFGAMLVAYLATLLVRSDDEPPTTTSNVDTTMHSNIAIFGSTGTIGDGLLQAAMDDPDVQTIHVVTRRPSPRIDAGVASGKVTRTIHKDYQDYSAIRGILEQVDTVYWAIGLSSVGMDRERYREIHVDYPLQLANEWLATSNKKNRSFHYVSGSGTNSESRMMWAQEKARAENKLAELAEQSNLRVISYRPSVILPTDAEAHLGHKIVYTILAPLKSAVAATSIGEAMLEISARGQQLSNGTILENIDIVDYSRAYTQRQGNN